RGLGRRGHPPLRGRRRHRQAVHDRRDQPQAPAAGPALAQEPVGQPPRPTPGRGDHPPPRVRAVRPLPPQPRPRLDRRTRRAPRGRRQAPPRRARGTPRGAPAGKASRRMSQPYYSDDTVQLYLGDSLNILPTLPDGSVDAIVCDPPYEIGIAGRDWDRTGIAYNVDLWRECLRVLKPGGHLLSFGSPRTYHRMACAIEDAG